MCHGVSSYLILSERCPTGYYNNTDQCDPCPRGQYQPYAGQQSCYSCPEGYTTVSEATVHEADCEEAVITGQDVPDDAEAGTGGSNSGSSGVGGKS